MPTSKGDGDELWALAPGASAALNAIAPPADAVVADISRRSGGYAVRVDGAIYIPLIQMSPRHQGKGSAFLDSLPHDETIKVPGVISARLAGMLERRGFAPQREWFDSQQEEIEVYVRHPRKDSE